MKKILFILFIAHIIIAELNYAQQRWFIGSAGFASDRTTYLSIVIGKEGIAYIAFQDFSTANKVSVMKFDGINWVAVGSAGFSDGVGGNLSLALYSNDTPYVVYSNFANSSKATVKKFIGSSWQNVGTPGFSADRVGFKSISIADNDTPYFVYKDVANSDKALLYNGINWVNVKSASVSGSWAEYILIAIGKDRNPFIVYEDGLKSGMVSVKKFDGYNWINNGIAGFSKEIISYTDFTIDNDGIPYVVFSDFSYFLKASVMRYSSNPLPVEENNNPDRTTLNQNYQNPFNPGTIISLAIQQSEFVTLKVYDLLGREETSLVNENISAGKHTCNFDASNLTSGVYFYKLQAGKISEVKKMMLVK